MYTVYYTREASRTLCKLPRNVSAQIMAKLDPYAADPDSLANNVRRLTEHPGYRLRVGDWRVLFTVDGGAFTVTVLKIGPSTDHREGQPSAEARQAGEAAAGRRGGSGMTALNTMGEAFDRLDDFKAFAAQTAERFLSR